MAKRALVIALVVSALGTLASGCGGGSKYTVRQALVDLPVFEHAVPIDNALYSRCVVDYLFGHLSPAQVKVVIQGADLVDYPPPPVIAAEQYCYQ